MKTGKSLLIPLIILVALIAGVVGYYVFLDSGKASDIPDASTVNAFYVSCSEVKSLSVISSDPTFPEVQIDASKNEDGTLSYSYNGSDFDPDVKYSESKMIGYIMTLSDYSTAYLVSDSADMSDFGLESPKYTAIITSFNGTVSKISFGNISYSGDYCYIRIDGGTAVYSVPVVKYNYVSQKSIDFIDTSVLDIDPCNLSEVEFIRKTDDLDLKASCSVDDSGNVTYKYFDPFDLGTSTYFDSLIAKICNLDITEFVELEEGDLSIYKLDDPEYHFILSETNGTKTEVFLSENICGFYYGYIKGTESYFKISDEQTLSLEIPSVQYIDSYVSYHMASEISTLKGSYNGKTFELSIKTDSDGSISGDDSDVYLDGRNAKIFNTDGRSYCAVLFESFACMEIGGIDTDAVVNTDATPVMLIEYITTQYENHTLAFYQRTDDTYYVVKDGVYMKVFVYGKELFNDGGTDTYNYGVWVAYELLKTSIDENVNGVYDIPENTTEAA